MIKNIKDMIVPLGLGLVLFWGVQYFFLRKSNSYTTDTASSRDFVAPKTAKECKPLNVEIDFLDTKRDRKTILSEVETDWANLVFSTEGASLDSIAFKREINGDMQIFRTIFPVGDTERENRCFLIGLPEKTPFFYNLVDRVDNDNTVELVYQAKISTGSLKKTFIIDKHTYKIDLILAVDGQKEAQENMVMRIFYPSPIMPGLVGRDSISSVVIDSTNSFEKTLRTKLDVQRGWFNPKMFGTDSRYFVHAMINDHDDFTQRAYYKFDGKNNLFSILEGTIKNGNTSQKLSFYFGPKESDAMLSVNPDLEKTLEYSGMLAPISKFLLKILNWLYKQLGNYGLAIIVLTFLMKLVLLPFMLRSEKGRKQTTEFQKKLAYLQKKYKNDQETLAREKAELIKKHGMPGLGGCLPLLLQMPIFFALSRAISTSIELYQAPMLWISDLSGSDPYYILPVLVGCAMLGQAMLVESSQRMSLIAMAFIFGGFATTLSSGLVLYIAISTVLGVLQTAVLKYFKIIR